MANEKMEKTSRSGGGTFIVLLCIILIAAGAALLYMDLTRDYRHGVYRCENGRMMEEPAEPDLNKTQNAAHFMQLLSDRHPDVQQYMMLVPTAACIQSGYLPEDVTVRDQKSDLAEIQRNMPSRLHWIDLTEVLSDHAGEKLYYASDTFLTGWGSRYAAKTAITEMGMNIPDGKDTCYLLADSFEGRLAKDKMPSLELFKKSKGERMEIYVPEDEASYYRVDESTGGWSGSLYDSGAANSSNPYNVFFGGERPLTEIHTTAINGENLLVIGDRTADSIVPLFVSSFENIVLVYPSKCAKKIDKLIEKYNITKILYLYGANEYMTDLSLLRTIMQ